ncbi:MAG: host-nuclease inhibitor Gam family protein [Bryobacteraceae bacterium]
MARPKKTSAELITLGECTAAMRELLNVTFDLERAEADRDQAAAAAMKPFESRINRGIERKADLEQQLQNYYMAHLAELEKDGKKSIGLIYGVIGRRLTPSSLRLLNRAWTWAASLVRLREKFGDRFIRMADPEIDKEKVKSEIPEEQLGEFGLKLHQDEKFFIEVTRPAEERG